MIFQLKCINILLRCFVIIAVLKENLKLYRSHNCKYFHIYLSFFLERSFEELDPTQQSFVKLCRQWRKGVRRHFRTLLLGTAGTGKTTTLKSLIQDNWNIFSSIFLYFGLWVYSGDEKIAPETLNKPPTGSPDEAPKDAGRGGAFGKYRGGAPLIFVWKCKLWKKMPGAIRKVLGERWILLLILIFRFYCGAFQVIFALK